MAKSNLFLQYNIHLHEDTSPKLAAQAHTHILYQRFYPHIICVLAKVLALTPQKAYYLS